MNPITKKIIMAAIALPLLSRGVSLATGATLEELLTTDGEAFTARCEGKVNTVYIDTSGKKHIGIGHLLKPGETFSKGLTDSEVEALFKVDYQNAYIDAKLLFPSFTVHPVPVRNILIDLSFNLGMGKLLKFTRARMAFASRNYTRAADELEDSLWFKQVGPRAVAIVNVLRTIAASSD